MAYDQGAFERELWRGLSLTQRYKLETLRDWAGLELIAGPEFALSSYARWCASRQQRADDASDEYLATLSSTSSQANAPVGDDDARLRAVWQLVADEYEADPLAPVSRTLRRMLAAEGTISSVRAQMDHLEARHGEGGPYLPASDDGLAPPNTEDV